MKKIDIRFNPNDFDGVKNIRIDTSTSPLELAEFYNSNPSNSNPSVALALYFMESNAINFNEVNTNFRTYYYLKVSLYSFLKSSMATMQLAFINNLQKNRVKTFSQRFIYYVNVIHTFYPKD